MERPIIRYGHDDIGDWVATLSCGHLQHVRHNPPFINRSWVTTEKGRRSKIGKILNCVRCDRFELPDGFVTYKKTPIFTEESFPTGLKNDHSTQAGIWAKIIVTKGKLRYCVDTLEIDLELSLDKPGIIVPEVLHSMEPLGTVNFFIEFYRELDHLT
jgi:tellurite resistance-related uncharacterized protein